jgi:thiamine biosynthesis protein ThiS
MNIILNGKKHTCKCGGRLPELLAEIKADPGCVAVVVNDRIIPRREHSSCRIRQNDQVEIVTFARGG